jgi:recombinational DNA repair ATPase RecF
MATEYRPTVVGTPAEGKKVDSQTAIKKMENELAEMAVSMRQTRRDYVDGMISDAEIDKVEKQFLTKLTEQRNFLQLLRRSVGEK